MCCWVLRVCCVALQVRAEGQYINDKIDLLVQYLLVDPFQALYTRVFKRKARTTSFPDLLQRAHISEIS